MRAHIHCLPLRRGLTGLLFGAALFFMACAHQGSSVPAGSPALGRAPVPTPNSGLEKAPLAKPATSPIPRPSVCERTEAKKEAPAALRWLHTRLLMHSKLLAHEAPMVRVLEKNAQTGKSTEHSTTLPLLFDKKTQVLLVYLWSPSCTSCVEAWPALAAQLPALRMPKTKLLLLAEEDSLDTWRTFWKRTPLAPLPPYALPANVVGDPACMPTPEYPQRPLLLVLEKIAHHRRERAQKGDHAIAVDREDVHFVIRQVWERPFTKTDGASLRAVVQTLTTKKPFRLPKNTPPEALESLLLHVPVTRVPALAKKVKIPKTSHVHVVHWAPPAAPALTSKEREGLTRIVTGYAASSAAAPLVTYQQIEPLRVRAPFAQKPMTLVLDGAGVIRSVVVGALQLEDGGPVAGKPNELVRDRGYMEIDRGISKLLELQRQQEASPAQ